MFTLTQLNEIMREVQLAPSAHNTQPAQWYFDGEAFQLSYDESRSLPIADPVNFDLFLSLGAQIEGLALALSRRGYKIEVPAQPQGCYRIDLSKAETLGAMDFSSEIIEMRKTYRGKLMPLPVETMNQVSIAFSDKTQYLIIRDRKDITQLASDYDQVTLSFMRDEGYLSELYKWLRFSRKERGWFDDGLNAEAMSLNSFEAFFARHILSPAIFPLIDQLGMANTLIEEAPKNNSASFFLILLADKKDFDDPVSLGRRFYRDWLKATDLGVSLCPVSNLVDSREMKLKLEKRFGVIDPQQIFKIFRGGGSIGPLPGRYRLSMDQFLKYEGELKS